MQSAILLMIKSVTTDDCRYTCWYEGITVMIKNYETEDELCKESLLEFFAVWICYEQVAGRQCLS